MARIAYVFSSLFGANARLAELAGSSLVAAGAEVRIRRVRDVVLGDEVQDAARAGGTATADDLEWADGLVFSSPSHTGLLSASLKAFVDENHDAAVAGRYLNKTFTAFATSGFAHAGQERVVDDLNAVAAAWGCILVPPSTASATINKLDGNPYGLSFVLEHGKIPDEDVASEVLHEHLGRFVAVTDAVAQLRSSDLGPDGPAPHHTRTAADVLGRPVVKE